MSSDTKKGYAPEFKDLPEPKDVGVSSGKVAHGHSFPPQQQILLSVVSD